MTKTHSERDIVPNFYVTEHFMYSDFVCPCCDILKITPAFYRHMKLLEQLRLEFGFPIVVNSGFRCQKHNKEIGGSARSWHMLFATDIRTNDNDEEKLKAMQEIAIDLGFGGIGRYDTFLHIDLRAELLQWRG